MSVSNIRLSAYKLWPLDTYMNSSAKHSRRLRPKQLYFNRYQQVLPLHAHHVCILTFRLAWTAFLDRKFKPLWLVVSPYVVFTWMLRLPALCSGWGKVRVFPGQEIILGNMEYQRAVKKQGSLNYPIWRESNNTNVWYFFLPGFPM